MELNINNQNINILTVNDVNPDSLKCLEDSISFVTCKYCKNLLLQPVSCSECEILYCLECFKKIKLCQDGDCRSKEYKKEINRFFKTKLEKIKMICRNKCGKEVNLFNYFDHMINCDFTDNELVCWNCNKIAKKSELKYKTDIVNEYELKINALIEENENLKYENNALKENNTKNKVNNTILKIKGET